MSQTKLPPSTLTRRTMVKGVAAGLASTALVPGLASSAVAAVPRAAEAGPFTGTVNSASLCKAHHKELANHLKRILNTAYVDETMKNKVLSTTHCPHCHVAIRPDMMDAASFAVL